MFLSEINILKSLFESEFILKMLNQYVEDNSCYLAMEYAENFSLDKYISNKENFKKLSLKNKYNICLNICKGLYALNKKKYIHRDLKSSNILLTSNLTPKICDFGISTNIIDKNEKKVNENEFLKDNSTYSFAGTLKWKAPET